MSVYKRGGIWWYQFEYQSQRYRASTGQLTRPDAEIVERNEKIRVRQAAAGIAIAPAPASPKFQEWAEHYYADARRRGLNVERIEDLTRGALRFWGEAPTDVAERIPGAPYHDLSLGDVAKDPSWILKWETWLDQPKPVRGKVRTKTKFRLWSGQTKNQHRSLVSEMCKLAMSPAWRAQTGMTTNPFAGGWRDQGGAKTVALEPDDVLAILGAASYHLRVAVAIALLTPKLREGNILRLRWDEHVAPGFSRLTVHDHKTRRHLKRPLVAYVPEQLREILKDAKKRAGRSAYVITYQGRPVRQLRGAVRGAVERAALERPQLTYGRALENGITFHTLRHTAATLLAELEVPAEKRQKLLDHKRLETTMQYTHLRPKHEAPVAELLSSTLPIQNVVMQARRRPPRKSVATSKQDTSKSRGKSRDRSDMRIASESR